MRAEVAASRPTHAAGFSTVHRQGVTIIEDGSGASVCTLNATALAVWDLCDGRTSPQEMVEAMGSVFDAPVAVVDHDVEVALDLLSRLGLLEGIAGT